MTKLKKEEKECTPLTNSKGYAQFPPGYGIFPYIILKTGLNLFMQIPIHFVKKGDKIDFKKNIGTHVTDVDERILKQARECQIFLLHDKIIEVTEFVIRKASFYSKEKFEGCLVLNQKQGIFYKDGEFTRKNHIPSKGVLTDQQHNILAINFDHFNYLKN